ncbi:PDZK1-interacting protein 1 isoform X2 [Clinocottus analis]|uniref:PDZK1-interacting protein 1 isoform X2 n=1 Tax=Clinocottus analis TaxID=304258 RepID=UPI0035C15D95
MMEKLCAVISCLLLSVGTATAQEAQLQSERLLPQWLTGIIAVAGFLFLTFVTLLVKKAWCEEPSRKKTTMEFVGRDDYVNNNPYENNLDMVREKTTKELPEVKEYVNENTNHLRLDMVRSKDNMNAYDNLVLDGTEDKVTAM